MSAVTHPSQESRTGAAMTATPTSRRQERLALLARAERGELAKAIADNWPGETVVDLKPATVGLVMLRGRIGGDGAAFNFGEATMAQSVVQIGTGERGFGQRLGRDTEAVRLGAILDAIGERDPDLVERAVLAGIRQRLAEGNARMAAETAATQVNFFTLVRGDPEA